MEMPEPTRVEGVRRMMGMANYLGKFLPHTTARSKICSVKIPSGSVLSQQQTDGKWRPIVFISGGMSEAEKHYAQIEKEALTTTWACERLSPYLLGLKFNHSKLPATEARLKVIQEKQKADLVCAKLIKYCQTEWPERYALPPDLAPYRPERETLTVVRELLLRGQKILIPHCMRQEILHDLHNSHQGLWKGEGEKLKALMTYRATPLESGFSPAQLLMGRQLRTTILQLPTTLLPRWLNIRGFRKSEKRAKENQQHKYNLRHRARTLPPLQSGQNVWLPREEKQGTVIQQATTPRSYIIHTDEGQLRRNRTQMRTLPQPQPQTTPETPVATPEPSNTETHTHITRETNAQIHTDTTSTPYVTTSGRVSRPPQRLNL
ncbi:Transposon Ty3-G Gag-Pol poly [Scomber scombrus]|uniref:Transposon Ty3-G Gag-Pol poly n=1 Tax=Scomber scombrus TaxID=13677 RepID=A0AAV1QCV8_SCOSC